MVLSEEQVKNVLKQLGISDSQVTKELIEDIQLNCKDTIDVIEYAQAKILKQFKKKSQSGSGSGSETLEGILIASSEEPRFDVFFDAESRKPVSYSDYRHVQYLPDEDCYVLIDSEGNAKAINMVEYYVGYILTNDGKVLLLKSSNPLPVTPHYVTLSGKKYKNVFVVNGVTEQRELTDIEWEKLNDFIDNETLNAFVKLQKECSSEPIVFIGRIVWSGIDRQEGRGILDYKTAFKIGHGDSAISINAYGVALPRSAGMYIGLITVRKKVSNDGRVFWNRTILHPVKIQK